MVRKLFNSLGLYVPLVATIALIFVDCSNPYLALAILCIGVGFIGCTTGAGYIININEVGGIYSGVLFGVSNTFGTIPGIVAPYIVSVLTGKVSLFLMIDILLIFNESKIQQSIYNLNGELCL